MGCQEIKVVRSLSVCQVAGISKSSNDKQKSFFPKKNRHVSIQVFKKQKKLIFWIVTRVSTSNDTVTLNNKIMYHSYIHIMNHLIFQIFQLMNKQFWILKWPVSVNNKTCNPISKICTPGYKPTNFQIFQMMIQQLQIPKWPLLKQQQLVARMWF